MKQLIKFTAFFLIAVFLFASCKKNPAITPPPIILPPIINNKPPVANAGADQSIILPINTVTIDGSSSADPDGSIVSYLWSQVTGPNQSVIGNSSKVSSGINNLVAGVYQFELIVTDNGGLSAKDTVQIIINTNTISISCSVNRPIVNAELVPFGTLSQRKSGVAIAAAGDKIIFAGGNTSVYSPTSKVDIYDTRTQSWSTASLSVARWNLVVSSAGNKIFFAGGFEQGPWDYDIIHSNVDIYDAVTDTWSVVYLSKERENLATASVGNKIFFAGGNYFQIFSNKIDVYDALSNSWITASSDILSRGRSNLSGVSADNKIYFAGGYVTQYPFIPSDKIDIYDPVANSWSTSNLSEPKDGHAAIAVNNNIYWAGGTSYRDGNNKPVTSNLVEIRNATNQTSTFACLFQPNSGFEAVTKNNKIVFFTGDGAIKNKFDIYDITTNAWSIGILNINIEDAGIFSINNTIYVAGGIVNGVLSNQIWKLEF